MLKKSDSHRVMFLDTGEVFNCTGTETLLKALTRTGMRNIPVGCRGGGCGVCKVEVLTGRFRAQPMSRSHINEQDLACNRVLACCIVAESDLEIRVIGRMQRMIYGARKFSR